MKEIIFAGFGGQGVLTGGLVIAYIAAGADLPTTWMPSYGPTMRGGKANCCVKFAESPDGEVGAPNIEAADILVAMNEPSLDYIENCKLGAKIFVNSSAVKNHKYPDGYEVYEIPVTEMGEQLKNPKGISLIMAGAVLKVSNLFDEEFAVKYMRKMFDDKGKGKLNDANEACLRAGYKAVE